MSTADPTAYGWLHQDMAWFGAAACVTVAAGVTREQFVNAFGVDLASPEAREASVAAPDDVDAPVLVSFTEIAGYLVAVEVNGSTGSEADVLEATSMLGRSASASWSAEDEVRFACAQGGDVLYDGQLVSDGTEGMSAELVTLAEQAADGPSYQAVAMAMVETWTGARVKQADVERALTTGYVAES
ncbi:MAG: hypothetical protein JWQ67_1345 [Marmoricola sp.]|jgi:hypothetical protein|nr:hypothetical protein [Marmoricola sp.]MCW2827729.1 hypothetical protein [Marmoricola sp.]